MSHSTSSSASGGSAYSESSTILYDHEPFDRFNKLVHELCRLLWPNSSHEKTVVNRMKGGGFNRIIGLSIVHNKDSQPIHYILRIPRFEVARLDRDVAILSFVCQNSKIPVPQVVSFDTTSDNVVESPYMIQNRIPGETLQSAYLKLDHSGQCIIAQELGQIFFALQNLRSQTTGILCLPPGEGKAHMLAMIDAFDDTGVSEAIPHKDASPAQSASELLTGIFQRRKGAHKEDIFNASYMDNLMTVVSEMAACGYLNDKEISLCHLDLAPRNILVNTRLDNTPYISALLDWDSAVFAPRFMSCAPPMWIWAWNSEDDEDERLANETPPTPELRELKRIFEQAAGSVYMRLAYEPQYRLARTLCQLAIRGLNSSEDAKEADSLFQEWGEVKLKASEARRGVLSQTKRHIVIAIDFFVRVFRASRT